MFLIYVLTNIKTGQQYVGQTCHSIESRFTKHKHSAKSKRYQNIKLYKAMNEYGIENFDYDIICFTNNPDDDEKYWIKKLNTYNCGYNSNSGGAGGKYQSDCPRRTKIDNYSDQDIINMYNDVKNISIISKKINLSYKVIRRVLRKNNVNIFDSGITTKNTLSYSLAIVDDDNNILRTFKTQFEACDYIKEECSPNSQDANIIHNIKKCLDGKRQTAYNYKWKYI